MKPITIGIVARQAGVNVETIRFYEREALIEKPPRRGTGYRQYPQDTVARIRFIRRAKELGFSLNEIKELLELRTSTRPACVEVRRCAKDKILDIKRKVRDLQRMKKALMQLTMACEGRGPATPCPILEALED